MAQVCKGLCSRIKAVIIPRKMRYESGLKWCALCSRYLNVDEFICPCCKTKLRTKSRNKKARDETRQILEK